MFSADFPARGMGARARAPRGARAARVCGVCDITTIYESNRGTEIVLSGRSRAAVVRYNSEIKNERGEMGVTEGKGELGGV